MHKDLHEANRLSWNAATVAHNSHKGDQAAFFRAGGLIANNVARWQNNQWSALGTGLDREVAALAVWDDGSGSEIVVYQPCKNPEATCASIKTIKKAKKRGDEPAPATPVR